MSACYAFEFAIERESFILVLSCYVTLIDFRTMRGLRGSKECTKNQFDGRYRHSTTQSLAGN